MLKPNRTQPCYQQYLPAEDLEALRQITQATGTPYQRLVRAAVKVLIAHYRSTGVLK